MPTPGITEAHGHQASANTPADNEGNRRRPLAKIRHDLRTPVNHIIGFSEMLLEEASGDWAETFRRDLAKIHSGGEQLLSLVNRHITEKSFPAEKRDLHELCHELRTPVNHIIGYAELLMDQSAEIGREDFRADLEKILSAARAWLTQMEKHLLVDNAKNVVGKDTEAFARIQESLGETAKAPRGAVLAQEGRLLLADDDETNRELLRRRLEKLGYEVVVCADGLEAIRAMESCHIDLVLLDLLMPGLDGNEVLTRMKADPVLRDVPVVMLSALDQVESMARCIELGAEDYIAKPFNPVFLRARIGAALEKKRLRDREVSYLQQIQQEKRRSDELLHIILPENVAEELKATSVVQPRRFENIGVLFCDLVGFTAYCDQHPPEDIVAQLQSVVEAFEELTVRHELEKIKTIGDSFMATAGLSSPLSDPALKCVRCACDMIGAAARLAPRWRVRVGLHVGPVIAGVVGRRKYQYDVWGDTVNLAARMEQAARPGCICVSADTWRLLEGFCPGESMGIVEIKGKGPLHLFCINPA